MIEINLLPGAKKGKKSGGGAPSINFAAWGAAISARVKDKFLAALVASVIVSLAAVAFMFLTQRNEEQTLAAAEAKAQADSTRYADFLKARARAEAQRDAILLQLNLIKAIDEERYIWPHILDEVSKALPPYTWLSQLTLIGPAQGLRPPASIRVPIDTTVRRRPLPQFPRDTVGVRLVGKTVDIQALTRFMRNLEESLFLGTVQLQKSETTPDAGKDVNQFTLDLRYVRPDSTQISRRPLALTQR